MEKNDDAKEISKPESNSRYRQMPTLTRFSALLLGTLGTLTTIIYLFSIGLDYWGQHFPQSAYLHLVLAFFLPIIFLYFPANSKNFSRIPWYDYLLSLCTFVILFYYFLHGMDIMYESWEVAPPALAFYFGVAIWAIVLEAVRRTVGWALCIIVLSVSIYPLFAESMPSIFFAKSFSFERLVGYHAMGPESLIGLPTKALATLFVGFLVFGVALTATGAARFFLDLALGLLGTVRGGPAKVSIFSSAMVGSISGSVATNVITTGALTIPAMIRSGYPNYYAAAIESCASTGGVLMPPIMGAAAFVMASVLQIPYYAVVVAAIVPSVLYYFGLFVQVDCFAARTGLVGLKREDLPSLKKTFKQGWFYIFAFIILIYFLFVKRIESQAPFIATLALLALSQIRKETRYDLNTLLNFLEKTYQVVAEIAGILAAIGLLIGALLITGLAQSLSSGLITLAGGNIYLLVAFGAIASFILGMGLTTTACYLLLAILLAPALEGMGCNVIATHLFLMYCGMLSYITPPVALASFTAAALCGAPAIKTAVQSCKLGIILFLLPFFFVFNPGFVLQGTVFNNISICITSLIGVFLIASGLEAYMVFIGRLNLVNRLLFIASGILLFEPSMGTNILGLALAAIIFLLGLKAKSSVVKSMVGRIVDEKI